MQSEVEDFHALGQAYLNSGEFIHAMTTYDNKYREDNNNVLACIGCGTAYTLLAKFSLAIYHFSCAIEKDPHNIEARLRRATLYNSLHPARPDLALADCNAVIEKHGQIADQNLHLQRAIALLMMGHCQEAEQAAIRALQINSYNFMARMFLIRCNVALKNYDHVIKYSEEMLTLYPLTPHPNPLLSEVHHNRNWAFKHKGRPAPEFKNAPEKMPFSHAVACASDLQNGQNIPAAIAAWTEVLTLDPENIIALVSRLTLNQIITIQARQSKNNDMFQKSFSEFMRDYQIIMRLQPNHLAAINRCIEVLKAIPRRAEVTILNTSLARLTSPHANTAILETKTMPPIPEKNTSENNATAPKSTATLADLVTKEKQAQETLAALKKETKTKTPEKNTLPEPSITLTGLSAKAKKAEETVAILITDNTKLTMKIAEDKSQRKINEQKLKQVTSNKQINKFSKNILNCLEHIHKLLITTELESLQKDSAEIAKKCQDAEASNNLLALSAAINKLESDIAILKNRIADQKFLYPKYIEKLDQEMFKLQTADNKASSSDTLSNAKTTFFTTPQTKALEPNMADIADKQDPIFILGSILSLSAHSKFILKSCNDPNTFLEHINMIEQQFMQKKLYENNNKQAAQQWTALYQKYPNGILMSFLQQEQEIDIDSIFSTILEDCQFLVQQGWEKMIEQALQMYEANQTLLKNSRKLP